MNKGTLNKHSDLRGPPLYVGQMNTPPADKVRTKFKEIFERRFYTNHGPLVAEFESCLAQYLGVKHVVCMTNGTVALMVAAKALGLRGDVIVPAFTFPATAQALSYAGLRPVFCDVDPILHNATVNTVRAALTTETVAILPVHLWGRSCDIDAFCALSREIGAALFFDAAHALGCTYNGRKIGGFGTCEVFSFHATKILNCTEGGCVATNDDQLALTLRTIGNFHEQHTFVDVPLRLNAKMSEAQAAMGLLSLEDLEANINANCARYARYKERLADIPGLSFIDHAHGENSNCQYVVLQVEAKKFGMNRDHLANYLKKKGIIARRYFYPGLHKAFPYSNDTWSLPVTDQLCDSIIQVPSGEMVSDSHIDMVCEIIRTAQANAGNLQPGTDKTKAPFR